MKGFLDAVLLRRAEEQAAAARFEPHGAEAYETRLEEERERVIDQVVEFVRSHRRHVGADEVADHFGIHMNTATKRLSRAVQQGRLKRVALGVYR